MRTSIALAAALLGLAPSVSASCAQASRFGDSNIIVRYNRPLVAGNAIQINTNYTCAHQLGFTPAFTQYNLVPTNVTAKAPATAYSLARHDSPPTQDSATVQIPDGNFWPHANYVLEVLMTYTVKGSYASGGEQFALNIAATVKS